MSATAEMQWRSPLAKLPFFECRPQAFQKCVGRFDSHETADVTARNLPVTSRKHAARMALQKRLNNPRKQFVELLMDHKPTSPVTGHLITRAQVHRHGRNGPHRDSPALFRTRLVLEAQLLLRESATLRYCSSASSCSGRNHSCT